MEDKKVEAKKVEAKKDTKQKANTVVSALIKVSTGKDRKDLFEKVLSTLHKAGVTKNIKGNPIKIENVTSQGNAIMRDIISERQGWWSNYEVIENEKEIKVVKKKAL